MKPTWPLDDDQDPASTSSFDIAVLKPTLRTTKTEDYTLSAGFFVAVGSRFNGTVRGLRAQDSTE
jgi:hypothetical protein